MRILLIHPGPAFSVADIHAGWLEGLRENGATVASVNLDDRLGFYSSAGRVVAETGEFIRMVDETGAVRLAAKGIEAACFDFLPDVVVVVSCFYVPFDTLDLIRARGIKVVILGMESPYEDDRQIARSAHADLTVINDPTNLERFAAVGRVEFIPHAYRPSLHCPGPADPDAASDFVFVGTGYASRIAFLEAVDWDGIDTALAGNWQQLDADSPLTKFVAHDIADCIFNTEAVTLYRSTKASANLYRKEAERPELSAGWSMGPREVELAATGCFFLTEARGENRAVLPMVPTFDGPGDFGERLRWWLSHDDERQAVVDQARAAIADRTFTHNAARLLSALST